MAGVHDSGLARHLEAAPEIEEVEPYTMGFWAFFAGYAVTACPPSFNEWEANEWKEGYANAKFIDA